MVNHIKGTLARPMVQIVMIVQPFVVATTIFMVYRAGAKIENLAAYVILGGGLAGIWSAMTFSSSGDINRERNFGTLPIMMASPSSLPFIFTAKIIGNAILSLIAMIISMLYSQFLLNVGVNIPHSFAFLGALAAFLFGASSFALCLSALFLLSRTTAIMQNFLEYPLLLLGGLAFPVTILPVWVQWISALLPIRWGSDALRQTFESSALGQSFWQSLGLTILTGLLYYALSLFLFNRIEYRTRCDASLDLQ